MSNYVYGKDDRFYCAKQAAFDAIRNAGGAASLAATDACKHRSFTATPMRARLAATDKEAQAFLGYIDRTRRGRYSATASVSMPLFGASGAGVAPDCGPILESAYGKETIVEATSVTYGPAGAKYMDEAAPVACELWGFNAAVRGVCAYGSIPNRLTLSAGQDSAELLADFICRYAIDQDRFANAETSEKGGLTSWPAEPASQTYTGSEITGFILLLTLDGVAYNPRSVSHTANFNRAYRMDKCAVDGTQYYGAEPHEGVPEFLLDAELWSNDGSDLAALLAKIENRTSFDGSIQIGATAGGIYTIPLNNLILPETARPAHEDGDDRKVVRLQGLRAQCTSTSARDEAKIVIT